MDEFRKLLAQENHAFNFNYNHDGSKINKVPLQNCTWRRLAVQWCYDILDSIGNTSVIQDGSNRGEIVYITMSTFDRYLALPKNADRRNNIAFYEISIISSLLLILKHFSPSEVIFDDPFSFFFSLQYTDKGTSSARSISSITVNDIRKICKDIYCTSLSPSWDSISSLTPIRFIKVLMKLFWVDAGVAQLERLAIRQIYESPIVMDEHCMMLPPSLIAWMSIENAFLLLQQQHDDDSDAYYHYTLEDQSNFRRLVMEISGHSYNAQLQNILLLRKNNDDGLRHRIIPNNKEVEEELDLTMMRVLHDVIIGSNRSSGDDNNSNRISPFSSKWIKCDDGEYLRQ